MKSMKKCVVTNNKMKIKEKLDKRRRNKRCSSAGVFCTSSAGAVTSLILVVAIVVSALISTFILNNEVKDAYAAPKFFTVYFHANGGSNAPDSEECAVVNLECSVTISSTIPTRSDYTFLGWNESSTATVATYQPGDSVSGGADDVMDLYAIWGSNSGGSSNSSITLNISDSNLSFNLIPTSTTGSFVKSNNMNISVTTDYSYGYTLGIMAANSTSLVGSNNSNNTFTTIGSATSEGDFGATAGSDYNGKWGYKPSHYNSTANTNFRPSPSTNGDTLMRTECANGTADTSCSNAVDSYTLAIGARADYSTPADSYSNTFVISAIANAAPLVIDYQANNSYYDGAYFGNDSSKTVNTVFYDAASQQAPITNPQYSHTANISDDGTNSGDYANSLNTNEVISFPGADHLGLSLTYQTESCCDFVVVWPGNHPNYRAGTSADVSLGTKYANSTKTTTTTTINNSAVTFGFKSDSSVTNYGYYAVVTGYDASGNAMTHSTEYTKSVISGTYATPTLPAGMNFAGWATTNNATTATYANENEISTNLAAVSGDPDVTLYPVYTSNVTIKTSTGISNVYIRELGTSTNVCSTSSTSGTTCALSTGKSYTLTMSASTGYSFSSWTKTGAGTIASTSSSSTTFTVGAGATTITASATPNTYTITVNVIGGISNITFTNSTYGSQSVGGAGGTVQLRYNQRYDISVTLANGNHFLSWAKTTGSGTLGSTSTMNTYFTPGSGTATLQIRAANTQIKTADGIDSVTISKDGETICTTTDATTGSYCNLILGTEYDITATLHQGYSFSSWSNTGNGTIGSSSTMTTTFTPVSSSAIDVITPSAVGNPYTVTVVFGNANVTSVTVNGTTFTTSGGTITLTAGTAYTISGTTDLNSVKFTSSANGTVSGSTYTIYGDATLTAEGIGRIYMQSMTDSDCVTSTPTTVYDDRDNKEYKVQRLTDGKCWMLDNLALDIVEHKNDLTSANTNANTTSLNYLNGTTSPRSTSDLTNPYPTAAVSYWTSSTYTYSAPWIAIKNASNENWNPDTVPANAPSGSLGSNKVGIYYNYCAASAGSYCYGNGTSQGTSSGNASEDICPSGWRMPTGGSSGEYNNLYTNGYSSNATNFKVALSIPLSGYFSNGSADFQGTDGFFWSSTWYSDYRMYYLYVGSSGVGPADYSVRPIGYPVRCIKENDPH